MYIHVPRIIHAHFFSEIGILAGLWPCGTISLLCELFIAESKAQVYGHLHSALQEAPGTRDNLSKHSTCTTNIIVYYINISIAFTISPFNWHIVSEVFTRINLNPQGSFAMTMVATYTSMHAIPYDEIPQSLHRRLLK